MAAALKRADARKVMLQLPEGLKMQALGIMDFLESAGLSVVLSADACYGACDLPVDDAALMQCDTILHVGHSKFYVDTDTKGIRVVYWPWFLDAAADGIDFSVIQEKRIGLITNIQHMKLLSEVREKLESVGKSVVIGGQILGCWTPNAEKIADEVDAFLFVGTGKFHPLAVTGKRVYSLDVEKRCVTDITEDMIRMERVRYARLFKARDARSFGILVTTKLGQHHLLARADEIRRALEKKDKKAYILVMDEVRSEKLLGLKVDAFVNTACPRILDDVFDRPVINAEDVEKL